MKTSTVTSSFYYVFIISLYCNDSIPSFIRILWRVLLLGNHLNKGQYYFFSLLVFLHDSLANQKAVFALVYYNSFKLNYIPTIILIFNVSQTESDALVLTASFISQDIQVLRKEVHIKPVSAIFNSLKSAMGIALIYSRCLISTRYSKYFRKKPLIFYDQQESNKQGTPRKQAP